MAKRKRHRASSAARRRRRPASANPGRRRGRKHKLFTSSARRAVGLNPPRRRRRHHPNPRRRHYRRNPGITGSVKGVGGMLVQGLKDGFVVRLGGGLSSYVAQKIPVGTAGTPTAGAVQLVVGAGLAMAVKRLMGPRTAAFFLAGAAADVIGTFIPNTIPVVGPILGKGALSSYARVPMGVSSYARLPGGASSYVRPTAAMSGWDDNDPNLSDGIFS